MVYLIIILVDHVGKRASLFMHEQVFSECTYVCVETASTKLGFVGYDLYCICYLSSLL